MNNYSNFYYNVGELQGLLNPLKVALEVLVNLVYPSCSLGTMNMGAVVIEERSTGFVDRGYPVQEATIYIYCDACGSFNIKTYIPVYKLLIIALMVTAMAFLVKADIRWVLCLVPLMVISVYLPWKDMLLKYKCRKCGNTKITDFNSLHYQAYNLSVVDVPDHKAQKRYMDSDVTHFNQYI